MAKQKRPKNQITEAVELTDEQVEAIEVLSGKFPRKVNKSLAPESPRGEIFSPEKATPQIQESPEPVPSEEISPESQPSISILDPLLEHPDLTHEEKIYLSVLAEGRMPYDAMQETWNKHKIRVSMGKLAAWCRTNPVFSDAYNTLKAIYSDKLAMENLSLAAGGKIAGGAATMRIQQLNRLLPSEYLQGIVQNIHNTITYKVDGDFKEPKDVKPDLAGEKISPENEKTH